MTASQCTNHPEKTAVYECDGCRELLCESCVEESVKLLLCKLCGERALPIGEEGAATVQERQQQVKIATVSGYSVAQALVYPFRGMGLFMYIAGLVSLLGLGFLLRYGLGCLPLVFWLGWLTLLAGVQFKIVSSTAQGDDEVPDWPEYFSLGERAVEFLTWLVIVGLQYGPALLFLFAFGQEGLFTTEPSLAFWIGVAACLWLGTALAIMGYGAAGVHWRHSALRVDQHLRALFATGAEALKIANVAFLLLGLTFVLKGLFEGIPLIGSVLAAALGLYWAFLEPHLAGLLFRRHGRALHEIYEG